MRLAIFGATMTPGKHLMAQALEQLRQVRSEAFVGLTPAIVRH